MQRKKNNNNEATRMNLHHCVSTFILLLFLATKVQGTNITLVVCQNEKYEGNRLNCADHACKSLLNGKLSIEHKFRNFCEQNCPRCYNAVQRMPKPGKATNPKTETPATNHSTQLITEHEQTTPVPTTGSIKDSTLPPSWNHGWTALLVVIAILLLIIIGLIYKFRKDIMSGASKLRTKFSCLSRNPSGSSEATGVESSQVEEPGSGPTDPLVEQPHDMRSVSNETQRAAEDSPFTHKSLNVMAPAMAPNLTHPPVAHSAEAAQTDQQPSNRSTFHAGPQGGPRMEAPRAPPIGAPPRIGANGTPPQVNASGDNYHQTGNINNINGDFHVHLPNQTPAAQINNPATATPMENIRYPVPEEGKLTDAEQARDNDGRHKLSV